MFCGYLWTNKINYSSESAKMCYEFILKYSNRMLDWLFTFQCNSSNPAFMTAFLFFYHFHIYFSAHLRHSFMEMNMLFPFADSQRLVFHNSCMWVEARMCVPENLRRRISLTMWVFHNQFVLWFCFRCSLHCEIEEGLITRGRGVTEGRQGQARSAHHNVPN